MLVSVKMRLPMSTDLCAILLFLISFQSLMKICQSGQIKKDPSTSPTEIGVMTKFDCHTCKSTINSFNENLAVSQAKGKDSLDPSSLIASIKKRTCQSFHSDFEKEQCYLFLEDHQFEIEEWLRSHRHRNVRIFDHVCVNKLKTCCFANKFGPNCKDCPSCPKNMKCDGEGTRQGNGTCLCQSGFSGHDCSQCLRGYYQDFRKDTNVTNCLKCHRSCKFCREAGSKGCEVCETGFHWLGNYGCVDIDECIQGNGQICGKNTFCVNTEGSHFCYGMSIRHFVIQK